MQFNETFVKAIKKHLDSYANLYVILFVLLFNSLFHNILNRNEADIIAYAKRFADPSFAPGDWYLSLAIPYRTAFNLIIYPFLVLFPDHIAVVLVRLIVYIFIAYGLNRLFRAAAVLPLLTLIFFAIFFVNQSMFAGEWIIKGIETKVFSYGFIILALGFYISKKYALALLFMGIATSFHILVGGYASLTYFMVRIYDYIWGKDQQKELLINYIYPLGGYFLGAILGLYAVFNFLLSNDGNIDKEFSTYLIVMVRNAHHLAPFEVFLHPAAELGDRFIYANAIAAGQPLLVRNIIIALPMITIALILFWGTVSRYSNDAVRLLSRYSLFSMIFIPVGMIFHALGLYKLLLFYLYRFPDSFSILISMLVLAAIFSQMWRKRRTIILRILYPIAIASGIFLVLASFINILNTSYLENLGKEYPHYVGKDPELLETMIWIRDNTESDACFVINPGLLIFQHVTGRCQFVNFKNTPQSHRDILVWYQRILKITEGKPLKPVGLQNFMDMDETYENLSTEAVKDINRSYGISHMMTTRSWVDKNIKNEKAILYENMNYAVIDITGDLN